MSLDDIKENVRELITVAELYAEVNNKAISTEKDVKDAKRMLLYMKDRMLRLTFTNKRLIQSEEERLR